MKIKGKKSVENPYWVPKVRGKATRRRPPPISPEIGHCSGWPKWKSNRKGKKWDNEVGKGRNGLKTQKKLQTYLPHSRPSPLKGEKLAGKSHTRPSSKEAEIWHEFSKDFERREWGNWNGWGSRVKNTKWVWIGEEKNEKWKEGGGRWRVWCFRKEKGVFVMLFLVL